MDPTRCEQSRRWKTYYLMVGRHKVEKTQVGEDTSWTESFKLIQLSPNVAGESLKEIVQDLGAWIPSHLKRR